MTEIITEFQNNKMAVALARKSSFALMLCIFLCRVYVVELSITLGTCSLSCNDENALHQSNEMSQRLAGPPGKAGPRGQKGDVGNPGARGEIGRPGDTCACSIYDEGLSKLNRLVENRFRDCIDVKRVISTSGVSVIFPFENEAGIHAYCDQTTDGGGWIVIQRRVDGTENFYRGWVDYVTGFGSKETEFWIGLEIIHKLVKNGTWELRVDLRAFDDSEVFAGYRSFAISGATDNYRLSVSGFHGNGGDSLSFHNNLQFSTKDNENDQHQTVNCAIHHTGAWWYNNCHRSNLNGMYNASTASADGVTWFRWKNEHISLRRAEMKIRRRG